MNESFSNEKKKRVSFAEGNDIKYIYQDDSNHKTNSSMDSNNKDITMDYTYDFRAEVDILRKLNEDKKLEGVNLHELVKEKFKDLKENVDNLERNKKESIDFNLTLNMDDTNLEVEDIIDTVKLKKTILPEKKESLEEFLRSYGIRFLDSMVPTHSRRDTLSKSKNDVDPALIQYYDNFLLKRIDFLLEFAEDIKNKMNELEEVVKNKEEIISIEKIKSNPEFETKLKKLKLNSRYLAKIQWNNLMANREQEFNTKLLDIKNRIYVEKEEIKRKSDEITKRKKEAIQKKDKLIKRINEIKIRSEKYSKTEITEIEKLNNIHEEQLLLLNALKEELKIKEENDRKIIKNKNKLLKEKEIIIEEINKLKDQIKEKNISDKSLSLIKNNFINTASIFDINIKSIKTNNLNFSFLSFDILLQEENNNLDIKIKEDDKILKNLLSMFYIEEQEIFTRLRKTIKYLLKIDNLRSIIKILDEKYNVEFLYKDNELELKINTFNKLEVLKEIRINIHNIKNDSIWYQLLNLCLKENIQ